MVRAILFLLVFTPFTLLMSAAAVIGSLFDSSGDFAHSCSRFWGRLSLRLAGIPVVISGGELIPDGPVIFMGNHQSNFDILALTKALPRKFSWIAKEELFRIPVFGKAMLRAGYIPLDRSDGRKALKSMQAAAARIRQGASVIIFPEGTRSKDRILQEFKQGGFLLAASAGVPIVPFTINGSGDINPAGKLFLRAGTIRISIHPPLDPEGRDRKRRDEVMAKVRTAIADGLES